MATTLVFETHSITTDNERGVATGWHPGELSDAGRALAVELGVRRRDEGIAVAHAQVLVRDLPPPPRNAMVVQDINCDLMDEDESGYVWTFLREALIPG